MSAPRRARAHSDAHPEPGAPASGLRLTAAPWRWHPPWQHSSALHGLLNLVHGNSKDDHCASDDLLPERRDADDHQAVGKETDDEGADDRAAYGATTTGERRATNDHRGNRIQLVEFPRSAVAELMLAIWRIPTIPAHSPDKT